MFLLVPDMNRIYPQAKRLLNKTARELGRDPKRVETRKEGTTWRSMIERNIAKSYEMMRGKYER